MVEPEKNPSLLRRRAVKGSAAMLVKSATRGRMESPSWRASSQLCGFGEALLGHVDGDIGVDRGKRGKQQARLAARS